MYFDENLTFRDVMKSPAFWVKIAMKVDLIVILVLKLSGVF